MKEKIQEMIKPTPDQKYKRYLQNFRKNHVPERYNQVLLYKKQYSTY